MDRKTINAEQNIWFNSQQVDEDNLNLEQEYNNKTSSSIIQNHIGSGVLVDDLLQKEYFSSDEVVGNVDGTVLTAKNQPSDQNFGNQLEVSLDRSKVFGRRTIKVAVIGLDFNDLLFYETFTFYRNEVQIGAKHFKKILLILVNDLLGDNKSFNLGGILKIKEAKQGVLSRDSLSVYQNYQPSLFWRDFFTIQTSTLTQLLELGLTDYDISALDILTSEYSTREIIQDDISTEIGQKFKANSNNIQKIRLLMSVVNTVEGSEDDLNWTGNVVLTLYPLQSAVTCPSDLAPNLEIDFDPINIPVAQVSFDYASLVESGIRLSNTLQPVEFILSNSTAGSNKKIEKDKYYCFSIKRSGTPDNCTIQLGTSVNKLTTSRLVISNGDIWVDVQDESLWFEIESDSAKVSSAKVYEDGFGIELEKTKTDSTGTYDYSLNGLSFYGNSDFTGVISSITDSYNPVEDTRTGSTTNSTQKKIPDVSLLTSSELSDLESTKILLKIGTISDKNKKFVPTNTITASLHTWSFINNQLVIPIIDDTTDGYRYDGYVNSLVSSLQLGDLFLARITPNNSTVDGYYRIGDAELRTLVYGDLDGDCLVTQADLDLLNYYEGFDLNISPKLDSEINVDTFSSPFVITYTNGYNFLTKPSKSTTSLIFYVFDKTSGEVIDSAANGVLVNSSNTLSAFTSVSVTFSSLTGIDNALLAVVDGTNSENNGVFKIIEVNSTTNTLTIGKQYVDGEIMLSLLAANIDEDFYITSNDGYVLDNYLNRNRLTTFIPSIYPTTTSNHYDKIGKEFNAIVLKLEAFIDREDDYLSDYTTRNDDLHILEDLFINDARLQDISLLSFPVSFTIEPKFNWRNYLIVSESDVKLVPAVFTESLGSKEPCQDICTKPILYPTRSGFDKGKNDAFFPDNIIIGNGNILNPDRSDYKIDFETGTIILEIPDNFYGTERSVNIFDAFIADYNNTGKTIQGFKAMKFADCTFVKHTAIENNQIRFNVAIQSFSPNLDGYDEFLNYGVIVDGKMGVHINELTGILTLNFTNLFYDVSKFTSSTRLQISVFLKKSGFNNDVLSISKDLVSNLFI